MQLPQLQLPGIRLRLLLAATPVAAAPPTLSSPHAHAYPEPPLNTHHVQVQFLHEMHAMTHPAGQ